MKTKNYLINFLLSICLLLALGCKKENPASPPSVNPGSDPTTDLSGFGSRKGQPIGTVFTFPSAIIINDYIRGGNLTLPRPDTTFGVLGSVSVFLRLSNSDSLSPITVNFPAGLILVPTWTSDTTQSGIIVRPYSITIPALASKLINLNMYCLNKHKMFSQYHDVYDIKVVSTNNQMVKLIEALSVKSDSVIWSHDQEMQKIIWEITDGNGLTQNDLNNIKKWQ